MNSTMFSILLVIIGLFFGICLTFLINHFRVNNAESKIKIYAEKAQKESEKVKRDLLFEAKEEAHRLKMDFDKEMKEKKDEIKESENRLIQREKNMDKRDENYQKREQLLDDREEKLQEKLKKIQNDQIEMEKLKNEQI